VHVKTENHARSLAAVARCLAAERLTIDAFSCDDGGMQFLASDAARAVAALQKAGFDATPVHVLKVTLPRRPEELAELAELLARARIRMVSAFGASHPGVAFVRVDKVGHAKKVLSAVLGAKAIARIGVEAS
jgi:hypothetical protein